MFKVFNVGCGLVVEIQCFIQQYLELMLLLFELVDFSEEMFDYICEQMCCVMDCVCKIVIVDFVYELVY